MIVVSLAIIALFFYYKGIICCYVFAYLHVTFRPTIKLFGTVAGILS